MSISLTGGFVNETKQAAEEVVDKVSSTLPATVLATANNLLPLLESNEIVIRGEVRISLEPKVAKP